MNMNRAVQVTHFLFRVGAGLLFGGRRLVVLCVVA
jgi:hypothetical protein